MTTWYLKLRLQPHNCIGDLFNMASVSLVNTKAEIKTLLQACTVQFVVARSVGRDTLHAAVMGRKRTLFHFHEN